jgi:hypothetical protein
MVTLDETSGEYVASTRTVWFNRSGIAATQEALRSPLLTAPTYSPPQCRDFIYYAQLRGRVYTPYYENAMLGGNEFGGMLPFVSDDARAPFAVTVIPVDSGLAVKSER